ncbi:MAG: hypothetical protein NTU77_08515 [Actinobacteria bacterium]|nr:hypothetical protein [Actinomycetota bacterium]
MSAGDPWWFSGAAPDHESEDAPGQSARGGFSLSFLAAGAQQFVDMAKQAILVPHADHDDPSEHGECIMCRGVLALDEVRGRANAENANGGGSEPRTGGVRWIDLDPGQTDAPPSGEEADRRLSP